MPITNKKSDILSADPDSAKANGVLRFVTATHAYTVFTRASGRRHEGAGVQVRSVSSGRTTVVECGERPRFYLAELKGLIACDPATPVGKACIR